MSADSRAVNCLAQQQQYCSSLKSHAPTYPVPPIPPQRVQSLVPSDRGPSNNATSSHPVTRSAFDTTAVVPTHYNHHENTSLDPAYQHNAYHQTTRTTDLSGSHMPPLTTLGHLAFDSQPKYPERHAFRWQSPRCRFNRRRTSTGSQPQRLCPHCSNRDLKFRTRPLCS